MKQTIQTTLLGRKVRVVKPLNEFTADDQKLWAQLVQDVKDLPQPEATAKLGDRWPAWDGTIASVFLSGKPGDQQPVYTVEIAGALREWTAAHLRIQPLEDSRLEAITGALEALILNLRERAMTPADCPSCDEAPCDDDCPLAAAERLIGR